jgi:hypothetical protein
MNNQSKIDFILAHPEHFKGLSFKVDSYASADTASFNKVLHNGMLQFKGWTGNSNGVWNLNLQVTASDVIDTFYDQIENLVLFFNAPETADDYVADRNKRM